MPHRIALFALPFFLALNTAILPPGPAAARDGGAHDLQVALRLASLLRSARAVIAASQERINDPAGGDKGLTADHVLAIATAAYEEANGLPPLHDGQEAREARLIAAQMTAIRDVMDANQATINREGVGFKGFVPAVFGRLVNERFAELVGDEARVKVTAPPEMVRNRKARPDAWETEIIRSRLATDAWPEGQVYAGEDDSGERAAFRVLVPEYYSAGCLACHGGPEGTFDVTGYPKEGGTLGALGGVISISLYH